MDEATVEDLAFAVRPWREVEGVGRSRFLSTREENDQSQVKDRGYLAYCTSIGAEFRDRREGRMENGVKNLIGSVAIPKYN